MPTICDLVLKPGLGFCPSHGKNYFSQGRKPFFWEEREDTPKGYSNLTMQTDIIFEFENRNLDHFVPLFKFLSFIPKIGGKKVFLP